MRVVVCAAAAATATTHSLCAAWRLFTRQMLAKIFFSPSKQKRLTSVDLYSNGERAIGLVKDFSIFVYCSSQYDSNIDTMIVPKNYPPKTHKTHGSACARIHD